MAMEEAMSKANTLGRATLALLVAADQRCPAIIGQAHLLHYTASEAPPAALRRMLTELNREAAGLIEAIACAEAALQSTDEPGGSSWRETDVG
jgi:hypothetical protein